MRPGADYDLPPEKERVNRRAVRLQWLTLAYIVSAIALLALVLGQSQAMKAAWVEDVLSLFPPIAFLVASRVRDKVPTETYPYGFHRSVTIGYLIAATALLVMGLVILADSGLRLVKAEHPSIGIIELFGHQIWLGWLMIAALLYSGVPVVFLGRMKQKLAAELHDKVLYADAQMNRADWMTAGAAILGILGIGAGLWWADAAAAIFISLDIVHDGYANLRTAVGDLMDRRPMTYDHKKPLDLDDRVSEYVEGLPWVADAQVRLREQGHIVTGQVYVAPRGEVPDLPDRIARATRDIDDMDWRLHEVDVVVIPDPERRTQQSA